MATQWTGVIAQYVAEQTEGIRHRMASDHLKNDFVGVEEGCIVLPLGLVQAI